MTRSLFLDWFHLCFVTEVRKYFARKGLPFKVLLILDNAPGHPKPHEFNTEGIKVAYLPPKHNVSNSGGHKDLVMLITHSALWKGLSTLWKRILTERRESLEGLYH